MATGTITLERTLFKNNRGEINEAHFDYMGVCEARLPGSFANEYYRRVISFLRRIGVIRLETDPATDADDPTSPKGRIAGAYVWSFYGYMNANIDRTRKEFLKYLRNDRMITLSDDETALIKSWDRMIDMAKHKIYRKGRWQEVGKDFLLGDEDGTGKFTRALEWTGVIPNINDLESDEMKELRNKLAEPR